MLCDHCKGPKYGLMIYHCRDPKCDNFNVAGACYVPPENQESLPKKMFEQGVSDKIEEVVEQEPKSVDDIIKRYLESQKELMEMIATLFIRLNKFKEI